MDYSDYQRNPSKYGMFKTAVVDQSVFTHNGEQDLPMGTIVGVRFNCTARNQMFRRDEPVYEVTLQGGKVWGYLFGHALTDFVI
jgi:hypothetical protein